MPGKLSWLRPHLPAIGAGGFSWRRSWTELHLRLDYS